MKYEVMRSTKLILILAGLIFFAIENARVHAQTTSLWLFDEPVGLYPSHVLDDASPSDYPMVLGLGGKIVKGKFGNALEIADIQTLDLPEGEARFGLTVLPVEPGRSHAPLSWKSAHYAALMSAGEKHLRKEIGFANATDTKLNIGNSDWTVEFWLQLMATEKSTSRYVFEIGHGPLMEDQDIMALYLDNIGSFVLKNDPAKTVTVIKTDTRSLRSGGWHHVAFVYDNATKTISHFVDGKPVSKTGNVKMKPLSHGDEAYMTIGRNGYWQNPLLGRLDELRFAVGKSYEKRFKPPVSHSAVYRPGYKPDVLKQGPPLLFDDDYDGVIMLGGRKHVFIDDAFIERMEDLKFVVNPPVKMERVIDNIQGSFRKHLTVVEDEEGVIRIYNGSVDDYLAVYISGDGVHFKAPDLGSIAYKGNKNITIPLDNGGLGNPFIDPNGSREERWKYFSDYHRRGIYLYTSPDGYHWKRKTTAVVPFRSGTQSCTFYDDQRQLYVSYHRSGIFSLPGQQNQRSSVLTELTDFNKPVPYKPLSQADYLKIADSIPLRDPLPWFLDNGPLTPGGFGMEYPHHFDPIPEDPPETDIYITKAQKYEWAPDTYLAFPVVYFHYKGASVEARRVLEEEKYQRGSGPLETQLSVSRDGVHWQRYPRPAYVGIGQHLGRDVKTAYIAHGMVKRGNEIWQYYFGETQYHSAIKHDPEGRGVYRLVQRLDGFVSLDSPYDKEVEMVTKPFVFSGNELHLNIDTDATGYTQVGFVDENDKPVPGFSVDECVYVNGDFISGKVEWLKKGSDLSGLQGKTVRLVFRIRGSKLYAMQFVNGN